MGECTTFPQNAPIRGVSGVKAGCILCGEIRAVLENGEVITLIKKI